VDIFEIIIGKTVASSDNYAKFDLNVRSGFYYQYMRNMLQRIMEMRSVKQDRPRHVNTDWSWSALFADYDNDSWKTFLSVAFSGLY
jgi:alpha-galactosidase